MTIHKKLDSIMEDITGIKQIQIRHEMNLKEHMRRTEILEQETKFNTKFTYMLLGSGSLLSVIAVVLGIYRRLF